MIYYEDKAREALLEYLNKPKKKLEPPEGKSNLLKRFKKDKADGNIYIIDHDDNGIPDSEIVDNIERFESFKNEKDVLLFNDKKLKGKYLVIFNADFPEWLIKALGEIKKKPSDFGFKNNKGFFHIEIRDKDRKENFKKILVGLNKDESEMLNTLKEIFILINHKS